MQRCLAGRALSAQHRALRGTSGAARSVPAALAASRTARLAVRASSITMNFGNRDNKRDARPENVPGDFFVDQTCIDCDTCRWMAPDTFRRVGEQSAVVAQPSDHAGRVQALKALLSCPTFSIHVAQRTPQELREAQQGLPQPVPGVPGVMHTGWSTEKSFAGAPYLLLRPEGNILVDSPRFNPTLAKRLQELGGVRYMFLTHRDDVGDHQQWAQRLGAQRILHELECNERQGTDKVEIKLQGEGPWVLTRDGRVVPQSEASPPSASPPSAPSDSRRLDDVTFIFTPGHTRGHVCLYYAPSRALFTGDHLCADDDAPGELLIFEDFNWFSVPQQKKSVAKLLDYDFLHVLPAHGRRAVLRDAAHRLAAVARVVGDAAALPAAAAAK